MKKHSRIFASIITLAMLFTLVPMTARAAPPEPPEMDETTYSPVTPSINPVGLKELITTQSTKFACDITGKTAAAIIAELQSLIYDDLPIIGIAFRKQALMTGSRIYGAENTGPNGYLYNINEWFVE